MKLGEYLKEEGIKRCVFAKKMGVTDLTLRNIIAGSQDVCLSLACRIEDLTENEVSCRDLLNPKFLQSREKRSKELRGC